MAEVQEWTRSDTARMLRVPGADDDKHSRGVVALRTGSEAYPGAAVLGVEAAWRAGAGFVRHVGEGRVADAVIARRPETVVGPDLGGTRVDAWVIGSGTDAAARTPDDEKALLTILAGAAPVVVDAGALDLAPGAAAPLVVTPHAREFARLRERMGLPAEAGDRVAAVREIARALDRVVLLKGARTLIAAPDGALIAVASAPGWLATAGAGDVLAGAIGALLAADRRRTPIAEVVAAATWLHGHAARLASGAVGESPGRPIVALDVAAALPSAVGELLSS